MTQASKRGSSLGFIVMGVVVAALVIGGAFFIRQQTASPEPQPPKVVEQPKKDAPKNESKKDSGEQKPQSSAPAVSTQPSIEALPQGGPADLTLSLVAVALLAGAGISYVRSRRPELSL